MEPTLKLHIGLIDPAKTFEAPLKEALNNTGSSGYVHNMKTMLELYQKMKMQKMHIIVMVTSPSDPENICQATVQFFRSKNETKETPIMIITSSKEVIMKHLITDLKTRAFSATTGALVPLMTMTPMISTSSKSLEGDKSLHMNWIETQFVDALKDKLGGALDFTPKPASDDETHAPFLGQHADEIRSHLGWFKLSARILTENNKGMKELANSMDTEALEEMSNLQMTAVVKDFTQRVYFELVTKGAIFFPTIDAMSPADRKVLYGNAKPMAVLFKCDEMSVVLELNRYL